MPTATAARRPSPAQGRLLASLLARGGVNVNRLDVRDDHRLNTWVAVVDAGWVTVDRGTPDNRGGNRWNYRYTVTDLGRTAATRLVGGTDV
jgi:hypothetical protein